MGEIRRRRGKLEKLTLWTISIVFTTILTAAITWKVTTSLTDNAKTKVYDYAFINKSEPSHQWNGDAKCWNGISPRDDVYKCSKGDRLYAPCFRDDISNNLKCPTNPKTNDGSKFFHAKFTDASEPLMKNFGKEPLPWYIYLKSGDECRYIYGATTTIANKRMDFSCNNDHMTLYLPVKDNDGSMSIGCLKKNILEQCEISEMWQ